ncbi:MAG TPA: hypothetical protein VMY77_00215 [Chitinophagaceae bacterium]|nr:hypothetical protein [Chitinophagaceae bacterium]
MKYLFGIVILFSGHSFAQSTCPIITDNILGVYSADPLNAYNKNIVANWNGEYQRIGPYKVKGSPYLFGEAYPGYINYKDGRTSIDKMVYFDVYNYKVGIIEKNNRYEPIDPIEDFSISLPQQYGGKELKFKNAKAFGTSVPKGFFNILEDGKKLTLLKYFKVNLMIDQGNEMNKDARVFEQVYDYYIYNKTSNELQKLKLKEKDIAKVLDNKKFMDEVIHARKIDLTYEGSVISAVSLYNNY